MNIKRIEIKEHSINNIPNNKCKFTLIDNGHDLEIHSHLVENSKKLLVFLEGSMGRNDCISQNAIMPSHFSENVIFLSDPLLHKHKELKAGWYAGAKNFEYIRKYCNFLRLLCSERGIGEDDILFYGSSMGGFAAVAFGTVLTKSKVVVNNIQTNLLHSYSSYVGDYLAIAYPGLNTMDIERDYSHRVDLISMIQRSGNSADITYYQNLSDEFHYKKHFLPFVTRFMSLNMPCKINIELYDDMNSGHSTLGVNESITAILKVMNSA